MGSRTSTRWRDHEKAPLIEESLAVDLPLLRREAFFEQPRGTPVPMS